MPRHSRVQRGQEEGKECRGKVEEGFERGRMLQSAFSADPRILVVAAVWSALLPSPPIVYLPPSDRLCWWIGPVRPVPDADDGTEAGLLNLGRDDVRAGDGRACGGETDVATV